MKITEARNFSFTYPGEKERALKDISFSVNSGELVLVCGVSGSGKTTLLKNLKPAVAPKGKSEGTLLFKEENIKELSDVRASCEIGFCSQSPEAQQVCDTVYRELAFGLENTGFKPSETAKRIAETSMFFGLEKILSKNLSELSGGEKQIVNVAAICAMRPELIILDEPSMQLSPVSSSRLMSLLLRLKRELGITVIMTEHRFDDIFETADRVIYLDKGEIIADGSPREVAERICRSFPKLIDNLPAPVRLYSLGTKQEIPVTISDGRDFLLKNVDRFKLRAEEMTKAGETLIEAKHVSFAYDRSGEILSDLSFSVGRGELFCILGANGSGKTTLLRLIAGALKPIYGKIKRKNGINIAYLPQNVMPMFLYDTLSECLGDGKNNSELIDELGLRELLLRHPYDLSAGEMQRAALCMLLTSSPDLLLLDEPTSGLDSLCRDAFAAILKKAVRDGKAVICVTHDVEFAAENASRAAFLFNGSIPADDSRRAFFSDNLYCGSSVLRMTRGIIDGCVTLRDLEVSDE
ncbi:MAG: ATP-binding cassette domain-containing protein [Clostridiales bacterium]|nr:ATP-binding cassette domain-containing protein [Clostridiales bacterium]